MFCFFFFKQKTAYEMRISDWSSDVCSSDLLPVRRRVARPRFDTNVELHFRNGREQIALNINGQGLERGNIKGVKPLGTCSDQVRQYRQKTRQRLACARGGDKQRSEEHTSELQSLMRISYAVFCLKKKKKQK